MKTDTEHINHERKPTEKAECNRDDNLTPHKKTDFKAGKQEDEIKLREQIIDLLKGINDMYSRFLDTP